MQRSGSQAMGRACPAVRPAGARLPPCGCCWAKPLLRQRPPAAAHGRAYRGLLGAATVRRRLPAAVACDAAPQAGAPAAAPLADTVEHSNGAVAPAQAPAANSRANKRKKGASAGGTNGTQTVEGPTLLVTRPLPRVLLLHTGGTLGMDPSQSFENDTDGHLQLKRGTGGKYSGGLRPGEMLVNLLGVVPELNAFANLHLEVIFNRDSARVGPREWALLARRLHAARDQFDAFLIVHGTDTMAYTAAALSLMLVGFRKPIVMTGSQLPLLMPRSDARQNLIDSLTCATAMFVPPHVKLQEVAICFGGKLMRGNRTQKIHSSSYQAFDSPSYPKLAVLGVEVEWNERYLLQVEGVYRPRFQLEPAVLRVPIVPGCDPRAAYGDLSSRGVKGIVLEAFGVGNMPDAPNSGWLPWLRAQRQAGLQVYLASQCLTGPLQPELYHSGSVALRLGVEAGPQMTPECAVVKMMQCLCYPDIPLGMPLAGEM